MQKFTTLAAAASITFVATASFAGGLSDEIMEAPVEAVDVMEAPAGSSISPTFIIVGVLAALLIAAAVAAADDDDDDEEEDIDTVVISTFDFAKFGLIRLGRHPLGVALFLVLS